MSSSARPRFTMVKKILSGGAPCQKCAQAEELLKRRGLWDFIDEVVYAEEDDASSPGMRLSKEYGVALAPFFLVTRGEGVEVVTSVVKLAKDHLEPLASPERAAPEPLSEAEVARSAPALATQTPAEILDFALARLGDRCAIAFSGAEDVALIDMASRLGRKFRVFCLDTGRLHAETHRFLEKVRTRYGIPLDVLSPEPKLVTELVRNKGLFSFYDEGHAECCSIRKVEPLRRYLATVDGWVTGQRRDQSPTRADVPEVVWDRAHVPSGILKVNPLARLTQAEVWKYLRDYDVPYNELHDRGFISIGCEPCTRPARPGEHERAARWWWEEATQRECGLHKG